MKKLIIALTIAALPLTACHKFGGSDKTTTAAARKPVKPVDLKNRKIDMKIIKISGRWESPPDQANMFYVLDLAANGVIDLTVRHNGKNGPEVIQSAKGAGDLEGSTISGGLVEQLPKKSDLAKASTWSLGVKDKSGVLTVGDKSVPVAWKGY